MKGQVKTKFYFFLNNILVFNFTKGSRNKKSASTVGPNAKWGGGGLTTKEKELF